MNDPLAWYPDNEATFATAASRVGLAALHVAFVARLPVVDPRARRRLCR